MKPSVNFCCLFLFFFLFFSAIFYKVSYVLTIKFKYDPSEVYSWLSSPASLHLSLVSSLRPVVIFFLFLDACCHADLAFLPLLFLCCFVSFSPLLSLPPIFSLTVGEATLKAKFQATHDFMSLNSSQASL